MPQSALLIKFVNEKCRPTFDISESMYETAKRFVSEYTAAGIVQEMAGLANTDRIEDGSLVDGRKAVLVREVKAIKALCDAIVTWYDTNSNTITSTTQATVAKSGSVNGAPRF